MDRKIRILLVEDDTNLGFLLVDFLESNGFNVKLYRDGESGYESFKNSQYDFCILDVMLPKLDGFQLAQNIKKINPEIPMIMLTAKSMDEDKIRGFNIGVDDYVTKPFNEVELVCRIKAILSRALKAEIAKGPECECYTIGQYQFTWKKQTLDIQNKQRRLTKTESDILRVLCNSMNDVVSRTELMEAVWGEDDYFVGRSLDVFISKIRKHLSDDSNVKIETIPKVGLVLNCKES